MLKGQKIVVMGGSSGMGLATAQLLAEKGASVVITGRSRDKLDAAKSQIAGDASVSALDFTQEAAVKTFFDDLGEFDHLLLVGAGTPAWGNFLDLDPAALRAAFDTKFWGYFFCARHGAPRLNGSGSILFVIGGACRRAIPETAGLAAVNGAIMCMATTLAKELAPIRVNLISPGLVDTPAYNWMSEEEKAGFFETMGGNLPVGRVGKPEEIAEAALFLVSNGYTTGTILDVDGGGRL